MSAAPAPCSHHTRTDIANLVHVCHTAGFDLDGQNIQRSRKAQDGHCAWGRDQRMRLFEEHLQHDWFVLERCMSAA